MGGLTCEPVAPVGALKCMLGSKYFSWKGVCCESFLDVQAYDTQRRNLAFHKLLQRQQQWSLRQATASYPQATPLLE